VGYGDISPQVAEIAVVACAIAPALTSGQNRVEYGVAIVLQVCALYCFPHARARLLLTLVPFGVIQKVCGAFTYSYVIAVL
jgi:hypothetical protein